MEVFSWLLAPDFLSPGKKPTPKKQGFINQPLYNPVIRSIIASGVNYKSSAPCNYIEVAYYHWTLEEEEEEEEEEKEKKKKKERKKERKKEKVTSITIQMFGLRMRNCPNFIPTSEFQTTMWVSSLVTNCKSTKPGWSGPEWYGHKKFGRNSPNGWNIIREPYIHGGAPTLPLTNNLIMRLLPSSLT